MLTSKVVQELHRRRLSLIRVRLIDYAVMSITFYYDDEPPQTVRFEAPHRCNCEYCDTCDESHVSDLSEDDDDWLLEWIDAVVTRTCDERWYPTPQPSLFDPSGVSTAQPGDGDLTIVIRRDLALVSVEDDVAAPPSDTTYQTSRFTDRYARSRPSRYRVTLTLMGGTRVITKVFDAADEDAALELAEQDDSDGWEIVDEEWKDSDMDVSEE